jgi:transcriptional regulator with XRE-family HTH domain
MVTVSKTTEIIGRRLKRLRRKAGLSQEKLSWFAGLNRGYVGFIERGARNPSITTLTKLAKALKVSLDSLFRG